MSWSIYGLPLRNDGTGSVGDMGLDPTAATARLATAFEVREAIDSVGAEGKFWTKGGDWFFTARGDSPAQLGEVSVQPRTWAGEWSDPIDAVSFRKPRDTIEALNIIQRLAAVTGGPWAAFTDFGGVPVLVTAEFDLRAVATSLEF